jgi:hypothetical protein
MACHFARFALIGLIIALLMPTPPAVAQSSDRSLLSAFCAARDIQGSNCKRARGYPQTDRACDVKLTDGRYRGRYMGSSDPLLVVGYESSCEPHATDFGGVVIFERSNSGDAFRGFQPGAQANECVTVPVGGQQDALVCLTGHMGQGHLESGVARMLFSRDGKRIGTDFDFLLTAENSDGAYGANTVTCKDPAPQYFDLNKLRLGPRDRTVAVDVGFADAEVIKTACGEGFAKPEDAEGNLPEGYAYVPTGKEKTGIVVIDLETRKVTRQ